jgi:hypothetical protein
MNIWNMNEHGIEKEKCSNSRVLKKTERKRAYVKTLARTDWISILEAVSADGRYIRLLIIFKDQNLQSSWFPEENLPDWKYTVSENG